MKSVITGSRVLEKFITVSLNSVERLVPEVSPTVKRPPTDAEDLIHIEKTVYDRKDKSDGTRILVMSLWPRGVKKTTIDSWMKELGTEKDLIRQWKGGKLSLAKFEKRYTSSLVTDEARMEIVQEIAHQVRSGRTITLLCSCKDALKCHRSFLKKVILGLVD